MEKKIINPVTRAFRRYNIELGIAMATYVLAIYVSRKLLYGPMQHANEVSQLTIALLPLIPVILMFAAIIRLVRGTDELLRRIFVDSLAIAGGVTALLSVTYGLIEGDLLPPLSAWWTYSTFMIAWLIAGFFVRRRYR
jgi:hypothetical protein